MKFSGTVDLDYIRKKMPADSGFGMVIKNHGVWMNWI